MINQTDTDGDNTISSEAFNSYSLAWQNLINAKPTTDKTIKIASLKSYFYFADGTCIYSVNFGVLAIRRLLSSVGVKKIMAKFAVVNNLFTIILYGTNDQGTRSSGYYLGTPSSSQANFKDENNGGTDNTGYISDELAKAWIENWTKTIVPEDKIDTSLLDTNYGKLRGYTYAMQDFMNTLYPPNKNYVVNNGLNMFLAAHDHHSNEFDYSSDIIYTFGMVLAGVPPLMASRDNDILLPPDEEVTSFYDLSTPSPPAP